MYTRGKIQIKAQSHFESHFLFPTGHNGGKLRNVNDIIVYFEIKELREVTKKPCCEDTFPLVETINETLTRFKFAVRDAFLSDKTVNNKQNKSRQKY